MPPVLTDPVYLCARAYQDMIDAEIAFKVEVVSEKKIKQVEIKPNEFEFKHLTGVQHLTDLLYLQNSNSKDILSDFLSGKLQIGNLSASTHFHDISISGYEIQDRISILTSYQQIMESIVSLGTLKTFRWERDVPSDSRPYGSNISADYLFQFQIKGSPYPYMNFFFKDEGNGHLAGISCFPSTQDYSFEKRTMKDGKIQMYGLSEAKVLTITETSRNNPDVPLKTISAEERKAVQERLDAELYTDFAKKLTLELVKEIRKEKDISRRIDNFTENKNGKFPDAVLKMMNSRLQTFVGAEKKTVSEQICECTEQIDSILKLRQIIRDLPALREKAYHSEAEMDRYLEADAELMEQLDNIGKCEYAVKELNQQISETNDSEIQALIKEETEKIKEKWSRFNELEIQPRSMNIEFNLNAPKIQGSDMVAVMERQKVFSMQIPLPPKKPFRALWQKIQKFGDYFKEKVSEIFGKKADAEPDKTNTETVSQQKAPAPHYSLESKNKEIVVHFMEDSGFCTEQNKDYFSVLSVLSVTEAIIRDVTGVQAERQMPEEKKVREVIQIGEEQETSPAPERQSYEYER